MISKNVSIKWPNDLLFNKQKICGILQEKISFNQFSFLIVGIVFDIILIQKQKL